MKLDPGTLVMLALQVSILLTVFGFGLKTAAGDLVSLIRHPSLMIRSLVAMFVVMPAVAVLLSRLFDFRPTVEIALIALAISPMPPLLPQKEIKAGGARSYAFGLMTLLALLAPLVVPLALAILGRFSGRRLAMAPGTVIRIVLMSTLVPLLLGVAVRAMRPRVAELMYKPVAEISGILLSLAALVLVVVTAPALWAVVGNGTLIAMLVFLAAGLAVGHTLGGPDPDHSVVLALSTACRHPGIGLSIATANFPDRHFGGAILLYVVVGAVAAIAYVAWHRWLRSGSPERLARL